MRPAVASHASVTMSSLPLLRPYGVHTQTLTRIPYQRVHDHRDISERKDFLCAATSSSLRRDFKAASPLQTHRYQSWFRQRLFFVNAPNDPSSASVPVLVPLDVLKFSTEVFSMPSHCSEDMSQV